MSSGFGNAAYGMFPYGMGGGQTIVRNWLPRADDQISRLATVEFDVVNEAWGVADLSIVLVTDEHYETVWLSSAFEAPYRRGSVCRPIANGFHLLLRRTNGWPSWKIRFAVSTADLAV